MSKSVTLLLILSYVRQATECVLVVVVVVVVVLVAAVMAVLPSIGVYELMASSIVV